MLGPKSSFFLLLLKEIKTFSWTPKGMLGPRLPDRQAQRARRPFAGPCRRDRPLAAALPVL